MAVNALQITALHDDYGDEFLPSGARLPIVKSGEIYNIFNWRPDVIFEHQSVQLSRQTGMAFQRRATRPAADASLKARRSIGSSL